MAISKGLYAAPQGLDLIDNTVPEIEIEIEDPEAVRIGVDGVPILEIEEADEDAGSQPVTAAAATTPFAYHFCRMVVAARRA